jgi:hypothetical protein
MLVFAREMEEVLRSDHSILSHLIQRIRDNFLSRIHYVYSWPHIPITRRDSLVISVPWNL